MTYVGDWRWRAGESFLDIASIDLAPDGTYTAQVEATLVNAAVRSFTFPCTLAEQGRWTAYDVAGQARIRLRPSTNKARVYAVARHEGTLSLTRRGVTAILHDVTFASVQCA
jgi:hypothetical protein